MFLGSSKTLTRNGGVSKTYTVGFTYKGEYLDTLMYPTISQSNPDITIKYTYDGLGRVLNVTKLGTSTYYARSFTYYKNDQVKGLQFGNGLVGNYTYDSLSRPLNMTLKNGGTTMISLMYGYNNTGTVKSIVGSINGATVNEQYRYDALQRLTNYTVTSSGSATSGWYEYDNLGNRVRQKLNSTITAYAYNSLNQLTNSTAYTTPQTKITYGYDLNGNLKTQNVTTVGTVRWAYTWNAANSLLKATNGTGQALYAYDGMGRMVESVEGSSTWFLAYKGTETLYRNLLNQNNQAYVFASGLKLVRVVDRTAMYYYHTDALGSTRMITYNDATYVFIDNYQPFGNDNGTPKGNLASTEKDRFTGKPYSSATGLYYYYQRFYDPSIGRFISPDPKQGKLSNPQSLNLYIYVLDLPTTLKDPTGTDWWNPFTWSEQQKAQAFTIAVIVVAVVAVVATSGIGSPLAAAAIGAALSTTGYTISQGDKATLSGAVTMAAVGAILGGAGAAAAGGSTGASLGNLALQALKNGALSGGINAGIYAGTSVASGHFTYAGLGAAFASGFVSGALGTKGILSPGSGSTVTSWAVANIVTGEASYIAGQYAQKQAPTVTGMWENVPGALAGGLVSDFTKSEIRGVVFGSVTGGISYFVDAFTPVGIWNTQGPLF